MSRSSRNKGEAGGAVLVALDPAVEAGGTAGVAAAAIAADLDAQQKRVLVAVDPDLDDALDLPGRLALMPEGLARAGPVPGLAGLDRAGEALLVHVRDHEDVA